MSEARVVGYWKAAGLSVLTEAPEEPAAWTYPNPFAARAARRYANPFAAAPHVPYAPPPAFPALDSPAPDKAVPDETTTDEPAPRRAPVRSLVILGVTLAVMAGAVVYPIIRSQAGQLSVPAALRSYVAGHGVTYAPRALHYSVRLPASPVRRDGPSTSPDRKFSLTVHRSLVTGTDYEIVIRETILPSAKVLANGVSGAVYDPLVGGSPSAVHVRRSLVGRMPVYDYDLGLTSGPTIRGRVFLAGHRFFLITVQADSDKVFDAVVGSFRLTTT